MYMYSIISGGEYGGGLGAEIAPYMVGAGYLQQLTPAVSSRDQW